MGDDNNNTCGSSYGGCDSGYGGGYGDYGGEDSAGGYGEDDSSNSYGNDGSNDDSSDSDGASDSDYSSDDSYSSDDDGDSYGWGSAYSDYSSDSYVSDDEVADTMDFSDVASGWGAVEREAMDSFNKFCEGLIAKDESTNNEFPSTAPSYTDLYDPEGYLDASRTPDDDIAPDSKGIIAMAVDAIADGITQRQQEITEELPDFVTTVNDSKNTSSYLSDLGNPDENTYTPAPDDVPTGNPGILSMGLTALADHFNHPPQELIDAANEMKETVNKGDLSSYPEDQPAEEAPVNPDDDIAPNSKGFISTVAEALTLGAKAIANRINNPSPTLQQAAQEMKDRAERGQISAYADDEYSHEQEENYTGYEIGRQNSEARLNAVMGAINTIRGNSLAKNTTTTAADTALSEKHVFTNASMTPIKEAGIKDIAGFAKYAAISSKAVAKNSVVSIGVGAMDVYDDFTNPNYTTSEKIATATIDTAGVIVTVLGGVGIGALISFVGLTGAPAITAAAVGSIIVGMGTDVFTSHEKEAVLAND
ncbi:hypothetical protein SAMN05216584_11444 [Selenomonas sp. WCT3]|uniref:hypothetical protein n=1 Tax=Selenomonas sp. WCT3 TaxID=3158785 RepID=UPI0008822635|nr:hypothetical protein SAMN05216584_11444 [Selenomonas ruminantium]